MSRRLEQRCCWATKIAPMLVRIESPTVDPADRTVLAIYGGSFIQHVLRDDDSSADRASSFLRALGFMDRAKNFLSEIVPALLAKETIVKVFVEQFSLDHSYMCLEYLDSELQTSRQVPVSQLF